MTLKATKLQAVGNQKYLVQIVYPLLEVLSNILTLGEESRQPYISDPSLLDLLIADPVE